MKTNIFPYYFLLLFTCLLGALDTPLLSEENPAQSASFDYEVSFEGADRNPLDQELMNALNSESKLVKLQEHPPHTLPGLKKRVENDLENIIKVLNNFGYYSPRIDYEIDSTLPPLKVIIEIDVGPLYPLASFNITSENKATLDWLNSIFLSEIGIALNEPATPRKILEAEEKLLNLACNKGYPHAAITKREVIADQAAHHISVLLHFELGSLGSFGEITLVGNKEVREAAIHKKICWKRGERFDPEKIRKTQEELENMGLFKAVTITYPDETNDPNSSEVAVPIVISLSESKFRTIGIGLSYTTQYGPGVAFEWEHRNIGSNGEKLSFNGDVWHNGFRGSFTFLQPDFLKRRQNLMWIAEVDHDTTKGYDEHFYSASAIIETQVNDKTKLSYGLQIKELQSKDSNKNGYFTLLKAPIQLRWSNANHLLDPTKGNTVTFKTTPTTQLNASSHVNYWINSLTATSYLPMRDDDRLCFASKVTLGSIFGASEKNIPPPERFYSGSENTLRGYHYLTVSPWAYPKKRNDGSGSSGGSQGSSGSDSGRQSEGSGSGRGKKHHRKPIGGRSIMVYSFEPRFRITEKWGWVVFYEIGNVYDDVIPRVTGKQLQSVGTGVRYMTPIGPLRLDVGFPLNRRKGIDGPCQIYASIGSSF